MGNLSIVLLLAFLVCALTQYSSPPDNVKIKFGMTKAKTVCLKLIKEIVPEEKRLTRYKNPASSATFVLTESFVKGEKTGQEWQGNFVDDSKKYNLVLFNQDDASDYPTPHTNVTIDDQIYVVYEEQEPTEDSSLPDDVTIEFEITGVGNVSLNLEKETTEGKAVLKDPEYKAEFTFTDTFANGENVKKWYGVFDYSNKTYSFSPFNEENTSFYKNISAKVPIDDQMYVVWEKNYYGN